MKVNKLQEIIHIIEQANIDTLNIEEGDFKLYYQKNDLDQETIIAETSNNREVKNRHTMSSTDQQDVNNDETKKNEVIGENSSITKITSPMIGTFYTKPDQDAEPYVEIGSTISKGDTVCAVEAMKLLNEVTSDIDGEIIDILVKPGEVIEYGQPLFKVRVGE